MNDFHTFPQCTDVANLQTWIGQWVQVRNQFGAGIPESHLKTMFMNILPQKVQDEVRSHRELTTLQSIIDHILKDIGRYNDAKVAKLHSQRLRNLLQNGIKNPVHAVLEQNKSAQHEDSTKPEHSSTALNAITDKLDNLVAALNQSNNNNRRRDSSPNGRAARSPSPGRSSTLNRPDPKFEGCWHCKGKGHSRRDCPDFKEILRKNGGKVPK